MNNNSYTQDLYLDSDFETDVLKSLGISPRIPNKSLTPKHFLSSTKNASLLKIRKESMPITSQRLFEYESPYDKTSRNKMVKPRRVSVGFFVNNQFKGKVVNNYRDVDGERIGNKSFRLRSDGNQDKQIAHATYSISRLLKMRDKLRKSSLISQQLINFTSKDVQKQQKINIKTQPDYNNEYKKRNNSKQISSPQRYQLLRSLKKGQIIRRKSQSKQEYNKRMPILSYGSTENFGNNYSSTQRIKLNVSGARCAI